MPNTGVKAQFGKCYPKSYIYQVCLFSPAFTQIYSITIIMCIIALAKCFFFSNLNSKGQYGGGGGVVVSFSKVVCFCKVRGEAPL